MFDFDHPFFRPLWRRIATVAVLFGWGLFEFLTSDPGWATLFLAVGVAASYFFFIAFKPRDDR